MYEINKLNLHKIKEQVWFAWFICAIVAYLTQVQVKFTYKKGKMLVQFTYNFYENNPWCHVSLT